MLFRGLNLLRKNYSSEYAKAMYYAWKKNPKDVHEDWNLVFNSTPSEGSSGGIS
jgi:2-oxoglutarate dehydrogenase complex dehydrogenase (E1) component-like enzyme